MANYSSNNRPIISTGATAIISVVLILFLAFGMWGCPTYKVWSQEMAGKAEYAKAEQNRKIRILEANANLESEKLNADAEVERAKGAARAIEIENGSITPTYIQYLWVRQQGNLSDKTTVVYIPTSQNQAGIPSFNVPPQEATRLQNLQ